MELQPNCPKCKISKVFVSNGKTSCLEIYQLCCKESVYIGPSGSGKSTLFNIIGALDWPTEGMVSIGGVNIFTLKENEIAYMRNRLIGLIFQSSNLVHRMTVQKNVELPAVVTSMNRTKEAINLLLLQALEAIISSLSRNLIP